MSSSCLSMKSRDQFLHSARSCCRPGVVIFSVSILLALSGCSSSKWAGDWHGVRVLAKGKKMPQQKGYSETKPTMESSIYLNGNGSYTSKFEEVDYTGDWTEEGKTITLKPKTYMGMDRSNFPKTKEETSASTLDNFFKVYTLDEAEDGSLVHKDDLGTVTYHKKA